MLFGSRSIHPGEHHPGMVVAIAAESILKLVSLTVIGLFVVYGLFHGFGDLFTKAAAVPDVGADLRLVARPLRLQLDRA